MNIVNDPPLIINSVWYGADETVGALVRLRLRGGPVPEFELPYSGATRLYAALGVVKDGTLIGGVVFHNLHSIKCNTVPVCIEASIAFDRPNWATRSTLRQLFRYPFIELKCATIVSRIRRSNKRSRDICRRLGFEEAGKIPRAFDGREDIFVYAMTSDKCPWIKTPQEECPDNR